MDVIDPSVRKIQQPS